MIRKTIGSILLTGCLLGLASTVQAQPAAIAQPHYPAGVEGIKGASLPPPGIYLRDYNYLYVSDEFPFLPPGVDGDALAYINAPRVIWMTDKTLLGASYGMDIIVPFGYVEMEVGGAKSSRFGLGDIQIEPLLLGWHGDRYDIGAGYAVWAPTGDFDAARMANVGRGYWSHMLTLGGTLYLDDQKTWAVSLLNRYELHHEQQDTDYTRGHDFTAEWGISKTVKENIDVGLIGYYQTMATGDSVGGPKDHTVGIGPEVSAFCPKLGIFGSLRYIYELDSHQRPEGHTVALTLTKKFK